MKLSEWTGNGYVIMPLNFGTNYRPLEAEKHHKGLVAPPSEYQ